MPNTSFQKSDIVFPHDKLLAATILKLIPRWVTPNHVTIFRFFATPIVAYMMYYGNYSLGLWAFLFVAFTDAIDGSMARTRDQITEWGKIYDPLADKILIGSMVFIIVLKYVDIWTSIMIVVIEVLIILVAWYRLYCGKTVQANIWGKIKMILQVAGVAILLISVVFGWADLLPFASGTLYLAIAFAIVSLLTYGI